MMRRDRHAFIECMNASFSASRATRDANDVRCLGFSRPWDRIAHRSPFHARLLVGNDENTRLTMETFLCFPSTHR